MRVKIFGELPNIVDLLKESFSGKDGRTMSLPNVNIYPGGQGMIYISGDEILIGHKVYRNTEPDTIGTDVIRSRLSLFCPHLTWAKPYVITRPDGTVTTVDHLTKVEAEDIRMTRFQFPDSIFSHFEVVSEGFIGNSKWFKDKVIGAGVDNKLLPNYIMCPELPSWSRHPDLVFYTKDFLWYRGFVYAQTDISLAVFHADDDQIKVSINVDPYSGMNNMEGYLLTRPCWQVVDWYRHTGWGVLYNKMLENPELFGDFKVK